MRTKFLLALCVLVLGISAQAKDYQYETVKGDMTRTRIYTLDNGLKVYLSVNNEKPRLQTFIAVRTGSKNDPAETTGLAHYLEHLMFKGTTHFGTTNAEAEAPLLEDIKARYERYRLLTDPDQRKQAYHEIDSVSQVAAQYFIPNEYDKLMAAIGAEGTNAFTSNDVTCYTEDIPSNEIENWAKIQSDRFQNMVIRGFHTELEAVYEEYNIYLTNDNDKVISALGKKLTPTHPYGTQTTIGTQEHLKNPSIVNIENYFRKWYVPNNVAICMAGDFDPDKTIAIIDQYFGSWKPALSSRPSKASGEISRDPSTTLGMTCVPQPVFPVQKPLTAPVDTTVVGQQAEQVWMGWLAKKASDLQGDTLDVIAYMLNNGKAGLIDLNLNQAMRVQGAGCGLQAMQDYSSFLMMGMPKPNQSLEEVRALLLGEIENLKKGNFSDDLLPAVINNLKLDYQRALESNRWRVSEHLDAFINGKSWAQQTGSLERVSKFTKQDIVDCYGIEPEKIDVAYNGVNEIFKPLPETEIMEIRGKYSGGFPYFMFVGSLHPRKNLARLFSAFDRFKSYNRNDVKLVIVGEKRWWTEPIQRAYDAMSCKDDVVFVGRLSAEDLHRVTAAALASVYVSYFEGFGIPILEAFKCDTPVITSNVTSMPEVAKDAALLVDPFNEDSIAKAMIKVLDDKVRERLIEKGRERAKDFSWDKAAEDIWNSLIKAIKE